MYKPLPIFIGLRYMRSSRKQQFISLISLISMLGIALGVVVLITILSVVNGFDREIKKQLFSMVPPITISSYTGRLTQWQTLEKQLQAASFVTAVAPIANGQALLSNARTTQPAMIAGIIPANEKGLSDLDKKIIQGNLYALVPGEFGIVVGENLAKQLDVMIGDPITVAVPTGVLNTTHISTRFKKFTVVGIFHAGGGGFNFDSKLAFIHLKDAQSLFELGTAITALRININDIYAAPQIASTLQEGLDAPLRAGNWTEQLGAFFENIRMTKTMMFFIFILIITVAVFNLVCTLVMVVKNKQADIAILRTFGATPATILMIFVVQGIAIGIGGIAIGVAGGIALAWNIPAISSWIQATFHVQLISANVYFVNYLPSELQWPDVMVISLIAFTLCLLATLYPAWNASRAVTAEVLNNE